MENKKSHKKSFRIYLSIVAVLLLLQVVAWSSRSLSDAYIDYIFPIWVNTYGRITGLFPFSVGEWLIVAGILVVLAAVVLGCSLLIPACRHSEKYCRGVKEYFGFFAWTLLAVFAIMTLNCTMIYHGSTFSEKYFGEEEAQEQTTQERTEELLRIYNDIVSHCNALSMEMERDNSGAVVYSGGVDSRGNAVDMEDKAIDVMQSLGKRYDQLDGYYPRPKAMFFSDFMCQMYMCGYYFPFSMEANYNDVMYIMEKPATMCHELFYPQLGVKLCSMAGGGVQKIYMVFLREPSRRDRSGSDLFHLWDGFEIKMNFDRNVSCFIFVNALMHDDFFD